VENSLYFFGSPRVAIRHPPVLKFVLASFRDSMKTCLFSPRLIRGVSPRKTVLARVSFFKYVKQKAHFNKYGTEASNRV
jgi:hypothetical protein